MESRPDSAHPSVNMSSDNEKAIESAPAATAERQTPPPTDTLDWDNHPDNALNWPAYKKTILIVCTSATAFVASAGTSIISPAQKQIMQEFGVSRTVSFLPLSLYVFALGFGPVLGGPLSETAGRMPIYWFGFPLGTLFTIGAALTHSFGALCFLRFAAGFCWAPTLAVAAGSIAETFPPQTRGPFMAVWILMPFLGPGFGPVLGAFAANRQNWRWTQWVLVFFCIFCLIMIVFTKESFPPILKRRIAKRKGDQLPPSPPLLSKLKAFVVVGLARPVHMMVSEPIVAFMCLYIAVNFGILFSFFAAVPYTFGGIYGFGIEQSGLVFLSVAIGCFIGLFTILACEIFLYRKQVSNFPPQRIPPEYRLYPAMFGSVGLPIGLFWYAWTAKASIHWASPVVAILPFAWGNLCVFVSCVQYMSDAYHGSVLASQASANGLARYTFAGAFPLFIIQMYEKLGLNWALSLFGFVTVAMLPIPWIVFKYGPKIRAKSEYETVKY